MQVRSERKVRSQKKRTKWWYGQSRGRRMRAAGRVGRPSWERRGLSRHPCVPVAETHILTDTGTYRQTHGCRQRHTRMCACMHAPMNKHKQRHTRTHTVCTNNQAHRHAEMYTYLDTQTNTPMHTMQACTRKAHTDRHTQAHSVISWNPPDSGP